MPKFGDLSSIFSNTNEKFEISKFKLGYMRNFVQIRKSILFSSKHPNLHIWAQNLKDESKYKILHFPNFETLGHLAIFLGCFGWFRLVLAGVRPFPVLVSTDVLDLIRTNSIHHS